MVESKNWIYGEALVSSFLETKKAVIIRQDAPGKLGADTWIPKWAIITPLSGKEQKYYLKDGFVEKLRKESRDLHNPRRMLALCVLKILNKMPEEWDDCIEPPPTALP